MSGNFTAKEFQKKYKKTRECANVLGSATKLLGHDVRTAQGIEQCGLPVVHMAHDGHNRCAIAQFRLLGRGPNNLLLFKLIAKCSLGMQIHGGLVNMFHFWGRSHHWAHV